MFFLMVLVHEKGIGQALAAVPPMALRRYLGRPRVNGGSGRSPRFFPFSEVLAM